MGTVVVCAYEHIEINEHYPKKPLLIACSGGGGHISAIEGVCDYLQRRYSEALILPSYTPVLLESKETSMSRIHIRNGVKIMSAPIVGRALRKAVAITALPVLPYEDDIEEELSKLTTLEARKQKRNYIDMLLDVYPDGYESAAVWNVLQRHDQARELNKLISFQYLSDKTNYNNVYTYYRDMLKRAARKNVPYTEVISTQAMAIPALCDAVRDYNNWVAAMNLPYPPVVIHQYMTDMPTVGAINFFKSLANLTPEQQYQLRLYGVGLSEEVIQHVFPGQTNFAAIYAIPPEDNPMVRQGFTNPQFDNSQKFDKNTILELMGEEPFSLNPGEKIATIMLGSQAGQGAIDYLPHLLQEDFTRIFIFGGKTNPLLSQKIDTLIHTSPAYKQRLVPLSNQQDDAITALMTRSNLVIIRGGGLSIMEQLAMSHNPHQAILVHHSDDTHGAELTSGIPWEDANVEELIKALYKSGIYCAKTSINKISRNLMEITLLQLITSNHQEIAPADVIHHLQQLSDSQVQQFLMDVQSQSHTTNTLIPRELELHLQQCERQAKDFVTLLNKTLGEYLQKLKLEIIKDVKTLDLSSFLAINPLTKEIISLDELDVLQIVNKVDDALFKNSPSTFFNNAQAYRLFHRLQGILLDDNQSSSHQKLYQFKENYQQVNMRLSRLNKAFQAVVNQILLILIKYFPSLREKLPPHLELSVVMTHLNNPHAKGPGFFSRRQENESTDSSLETSLASP